MRHIKNTLIWALISLFLFTSLVFAGYQYKPKKDHLGGDIAPVEALKMMKKMQQLSSTQKAFSMYLFLCLMLDVYVGTIVLVTKA